MQRDPYYKVKKKILEDLRLRGFVFSSQVEQAFMEVDRSLFVPESQRKAAYQDRPLPIGHGQTISAIHMVLMMIAKDAGNPQPGDHVLEIGTGSGYNAAILARAVDPDLKGEGFVVSIERIATLAFRAKKALKNHSVDENVEVIIADGSKGIAKRELFDLIIVTAAAPSIPPPLLENLKTGGRLIIPVGSKYIQRLVIATKDEKGKIRQQPDYSVMFVPLIGEYGFEK